MAFLEWSQGLSVGNEELDEEHRNIMSYICDLHKAIEQDRGDEILSKTLDNIMAYSNYHFRHEEAIFTKTEYPDATSHIREHDHFIKKVLDLQEEFRFGDHKKLSVDLLVYLKEWLINHIQGTDKGYVQYLKKYAEKQNNQNTLSS